METKDDIQPVLSVIEQEELLSSELLACAAETVQIVAALGGQRVGYRRERRQAVRKMVSEIYSAPRVTKALKLMPSMELVPGFALDLSGEGENGNSWDFTRPDMRAKARALLLEEKPFLLIGSPPCTLLLRAVQAPSRGWPALSPRTPRQRRVVAAGGGARVAQDQWRTARVE